MTDTTPTAPLSLAEEIRQTVSGMSGVHRLGTLVSRLASAVLRDADRADGVRVAEAPDAPAGTPSLRAASSAGRSVIVEVALVAEYPARIDALCDAVREQVGVIVRAHGHELAGVDVDVVDVHGPFDPLPGEEPTARAAAAVRGAAASVADGARSAATTVADGAKELSATVRDQAGEIAETARDRATDVTAAVRDRGADAPASPEADDATARISQAAATAAAAEARAIAEESEADRAEVDVEIRVDAIAGPDAEGDAQAIAEATPAHADDARAEEHSDGGRVTVEDDAETGAAETREGER